LDTDVFAPSVGAQDIYNYVADYGKVYFRLPQDGGSVRYLSLADSLPTKATFSGYDVSTRKSSIVLVYVQGYDVTVDTIPYSEYLTEGEAMSLIYSIDFLNEEQEKQVLDLITKNTLKRSDVIALLGSGDIGNLDMGGNRIDNASYIYTGLISIEDADGTMGADIKPGENDGKYAVLDFCGILSDERTILRNIAPGKQDDDAATVGQLNAKTEEIVDAIGDALDEIHAYAERLIGGA
jgi:hypothetical protein